MDIMRSKFLLVERIFFERDDKIVILLEEPVTILPEISTFKISPNVKMISIKREGQRRIAISCQSIDIKNNYRITLPGKRRYVILPDKILDNCYTDNHMGHVVFEDKSQFRFFAPRALEVNLKLYNHPSENPFKQIPMIFDSESGCWELETNQVAGNTLYTYEVSRRSTSKENYNRIITDEFSDPWSFAVAKKNSWPNKAFSLALQNFDEEDISTDHVILPKSDLVIYEAHVKDSTILDNSIKCEDKGTYKGMSSNHKNGFIHHLKDLGINCVELLPIQDYCYHEPPYGKRTEKYKNSWNPTSVNHWGYMTAHYFAPETRYSNSSNNEWIGSDGSQLNDAREMIREFHEAGIVVILDVVYNHVSQYSNCALRELDPYYFLRHDKFGDPTTESGCGNDFATERPMNRRLIIESLIHWVKYYGVDGFRFDLAGLIDEETLVQVSQSLRDVHPEIHLIAEPWGGLYDKSRYSKLDWSSWNDLFRDSVKGNQPHYRNGFIAGSQHQNMTQHISGNLKSLGGPYEKSSQSVNYLACHDGYTLNDFIRQQNLSFLGPKMSAIEQIEATSCNQYKLGLFILYTSLGSPMISQGDEFGRNKLIKQDENGNPIYDHDSYNKDNKINWIDWSELKDAKTDSIRNLIKQLIHYRKDHPVFKYAVTENIIEITSDNKSAYGYHLTITNDSVVILLNSDQQHSATFNLPDGKWKMAVSSHDNILLDTSSSKLLTIPEICGVLLTIE